MRPNWLTTASKLPSGNGSDSATPSRQSTPGARSAGNREHAGIRIDPNHPPSRAGFSRENPGAARNIQYAMSWLNSGRISDFRCPLSKQRGHEQSFICGSCIDQLPQRRLAHRLALLLIDRTLLMLTHVKQGERLSCAVDLGAALDSESDSAIERDCGFILFVDVDSGRPKFRNRMRGQPPPDPGTMERRMNEKRLHLFSRHANKRNEAAFAIAYTVKVVQPEQRLQH
jgi:hypothetical protein